MKPFDDLVRSICLDLGIDPEQVRISFTRDAEQPLWGLVHDRQVTFAYFDIEQQRWLEYQEQTPVEQEEESQSVQDDELNNPELGTE